MRALIWIFGMAPAWTVVSIHAETLTVATYNIENYVATDRMTDAGYRRDYPKSEAEKSALRKVIHGLNADVLVVQEMGDAPYLQELCRDLKQEGLDYPHAILLEAADHDRHVALLSKQPAISITRYSNLEYAYFGKQEKVKRGLIEAHFATGGGELTIFGLHLKSRFTDRPDDPRSSLRRIGEATAIRDAVLLRFPNPAKSRFLIVGDFNDDKSSKPLLRMLRRGETEIAELLPVADSHGETWTHAYRKEDSYSRVDHVLVSRALRSAVRAGVGTIFDGDGVLKASDHRPVVVTLDLEK